MAAFTVSRCSPRFLRFAFLASLIVVAAGHGLRLGRLRWSGEERFLNVLAKQVYSIESEVTRLVNKAAKS